MVMIGSLVLSIFWGPGSGINILWGSVTFVVTHGSRFSPFEKWEWTKPPAIGVPWEDGPALPLGWR